MEDELHHLTFMTPCKGKWSRNKQGVVEKDDILMEVSALAGVWSPTGCNGPGQVRPLDILKGLYTQFKVVCGPTISSIANLFFYLIL